MIRTSRFSRIKTSLIRQFSKTINTQKNNILFETINKNKGLITLNRPKALNALTPSMLEKLHVTISAWEKEKALVIIKSGGGPAFCAGGDVKCIFQEGLKGNKQFCKEVFQHEYLTNDIIGGYTIPYIALMDGIVMGGGAGLSVHGKYRVATERTVFAMPEVKIGYFSDVGSSYFLSRLDGKLGLFLALTAYRLTGSDVFKIGLATHYCKSHSLAQIEKELLNCNDEKSIETVLKRYSINDEKQFSLEPFLKQINKCFGEDSVENIIEALEQDGSEWAKKTIDVLGRMSPTSLKITRKLVELGAKMTRLECLQMEYRMGVNCLNNNDFYEGVRALLIDKDKKPIWKPRTLQEVTPNIVDSYFTRLPDDQELKHRKTR